MRVQGGLKGEASGGWRVGQGSTNGACGRRGLLPGRALGRDLEAHWADARYGTAALSFSPDSRDHENRMASGSLEYHAFRRRPPARARCKNAVVTMAVQSRRRDQGCEKYKSHVHHPSASRVEPSSDKARLTGRSGRIAASRTQPSEGLSCPKRRLRQWMPRLLLCGGTHVPPSRVPARRPQTVLMRTPGTIAMLAGSKPHQPAPDQVPRSSPRVQRMDSATR